MATTPPTRPGLLRTAASSVRRWLRRPSDGAADRALPPPRTGAGTAYPGDFTGALTPVYAPRPDGEPDPGEVVWTWVPYEEDHAQGKD
ncbi:MAG TPA: type II toxin-antitoxin system PemK/MazF family toxin, partial [Ornithinibacter sp.]|nr:type II toxin-antitoxin system PemK/MazF family toxin [Ornithinibacter sp.]